MMQFDLVPAQEIPELLASHVSGPYRFVQHSNVSYVRVGPSSDTEPITIKSGERLRLLKSRSTRLTGLKNTIDFTVVYDDNLELHLVQTPFHATQLDQHDPYAWMVSDRPPAMPSRSIHLGAPVWEDGTEGGGKTAPSEVVPPAPQKVAATAKQLRPMKTIVTTDPGLGNGPICDTLRNLAVQEEIDPALGDYLVIPVAQAQQYAPLPPWATTTKYVEQIHVVKPRLGTDTPIRSTGESYGE